MPQNLTAQNIFEIEITERNWIIFLKSISYTKGDTKFRNSLKCALENSLKIHESF